MTVGTPQELASSKGRRFGLTVGLAFGAFGGLLLWRGHSALAYGAWGLGGALLAFAGVAPSALLPVERAWMALAHAISKVTTPILMGIVYFGVLLPIALIIRMLGRNPLTHASGELSFWVSRSDDAARRGSMKQQF